MKKKLGMKKALSLLLCMLLVMSMFAACKKDDNKDTPTGKEQTNNNSGTYTAGTYTVEVQGHNGLITVDVTFSETEITDIKVVSSSETASIADGAMERIKEQVLSGQTLGIDTVSGATVSSKALLGAIEEAVSKAGGDVEALKSVAVQKPNEGKVEKLVTDVVVIGAGASGVSAAIAAADEGANVIIIEKTGKIGGASNLSWAGKLINSSAAKEDGFIIDEEKEITDWIENNHWRVDAAVIRQYVTKSGDTYDWLMEKGYPLLYMNFFGEQMHMLPAYDTREETLRKMLMDYVESKGGQVITETTGKKLMTNEAGDVVGVIAEQVDGTILEISAKSVIMATGGYAANAEMVKQYFGFEGVNGGLGQNVGEGIKMAWEVGARVPDNIGGQMLHQTLARATTQLKSQYSDFEATWPMMLTYLPTLMNVGTSGSRFRNEEATLKAVAAANTSAFNGPYHYVILSKAQLDALMSEGMAGIGAQSLPGMPPEFYSSFSDKFTLDNPWVDADKVFDTMVANGHGFKGNTVEELAKNAGMDVDLFLETFKSYEEATKAGKDLEFGKSAEYLIPMGEEGPFYAIIAEINNLGSIGGITINRNFQVINESRVPIKGLYAVGVEAAGVLYNDTYVGNGIGIGYSFTSGRLGGGYAATSALGK